jgi:hypothetical protein
MRQYHFILPAELPACQKCILRRTPTVHSRNRMKNFWSSRHRVGLAMNEAGQCRILKNREKSIRCNG